MGPGLFSGAFTVSFRVFQRSPSQQLHEGIRSYVVARSHRRIVLLHKWQITATWLGGLSEQKNTETHLKNKHIIGFGVVWIQVFVNLINYFMCSLFHSLLCHSCNKSVSQHKLHFCSVSLAYIAYSSRLYHLHMFCDAMIDMTYRSRYRIYIYMFVFLDHKQINMICTLEVKDHKKNSPLELLIVNPYENNSLYGKTIQKIVFGLPGCM